MPSRPETSSAAADDTTPEVSCRALSALQRCAVTAFMTVGPNVGLLHSVHRVQSSQAGIDMS